MTHAKINPLLTLIDIYGVKFKEALEAGDLRKAVRMCADYQSPDTGNQLPDYQRLRAFAYRVGMEALKHPEINSGDIVIIYNPNEYLHFVHSVMADRESIFMSFEERQKLYEEMKMFGVVIKPKGRI